MKKREKTTTKERPKEVKAKEKDGNRLRNSSANKTTSASIAVELLRAAGAEGPVEGPAARMHVFGKENKSSNLRIAQR